MRSVCVIEQDEPLSALEISARFTVAPGSPELSATAAGGPGPSTVVSLTLDHGENREVPLPGPMMPLCGVIVTASAFDGVTITIGGSTPVLLTGPLVLAGQVTDLLGISMPGSIMVWNNAPEARKIEVAFVRPATQPSATG